MLNLSLTLGLSAVRSGGGSSPWSMDTLVATGDSITNTTEGGASLDFYANRYKAARPSLTVENRAQGSRIIGYTAEGDVLDDNGNTLLGNVAEVMAYNPDLVTLMIGANDISNTRTVTQYTNALIALRAAYAAARPSCRVAWSPPLPYNPNGSHPTYANFTANRAALFALNPRNPAYWGQFADYYIPMGEHPDFPSNSALFSDTVHPTPWSTGTPAGQNRLGDVYFAAVDSIAGIANVENMWPDSETGLALNTVTTRRFIVQGIAAAGVAGGVSCSGASSTVSINGATPSSNTTDRTAWLYNGDVIDLTFTTSASGSTPVTVNLTIAGVTRAISYTTTADVTPISLSNAGTASSPADSTSINLANLTFGNGVAVVALTCYSVAGGTTDSTPASLTLTPAVGDPITLVRRQFGGRAASRGLAVYSASVPAGTYTLTGTRPASARTSYVSYFTLQNADPVPVATPAFIGTGSVSDPHLAPSVTVPANGIGLGWLLKENATTNTAGSGSTLINEGHAVASVGGTAIGIAAVQRATTGQPAVNSGFGNFSMGSMAFKALGS